MFTSIVVHSSHQLLTYGTAYAKLIHAGSQELHVEECKRIIDLQSSEYHALRELRRSTH